MTLSPQMAHGTTGNLLSQTFARLADLNLRSAFWRKEALAIRVSPISQPRLSAANPYLQTVDFDDNEGPVRYASFAVAPEDDSGW
jgi:hypothetical protein